MVMFFEIRVSAALPMCPLQPENTESNLIVCGEEPPDPPPPPPRQCTPALPKPADTFDCQCKTINVSPALRCNGALSQATCFNMIDTAYAAGLLTSDAVTWLKANGFCPNHYDVGDGDLIYNFCPVGCFAADTRILITASRDGKAGYTSASKVTPQDTLMTLADEASLREVTLTTLPIERLVYGPEEPLLFVFALATGATLRVTQHHPMILDSGKIVEASQVEPGMSFVGVDGQPVAITAITRAQAIGDVFNFQAAGDTQLSHIIVAEGVLVGDLKLQNELAAEQGSIALRR